MTLQEVIKESLVENIVKKEEIRRNVIEEASIKKQKHFKKWIFSAIACVFILSVGFGGFYILNMNNLDDIEKGNDTSTVRMFSENDMLYFTNIKRDDNLYSYDPVKKETKAVINDTVYDFYASEDYYFYNTPSGFYSQNRLSGDKQRIADCADEIIEYKDILYFVMYKHISIEEGEHFVIGSEKYVTLYAYDIYEKKLTEIKSEYHKDEYVDGIRKYKDISIKDVHIKDDSIYYRNQSEVHRLSLDGTQHEIIYKSNSYIYQMDMYTDGFYLIEDFNGPENFGTPNKIHNINFSGESICISGDIEGNYYSTIYYDSATESYYMIINNNQLVYFYANNPENVIHVSDIERLYEFGFFNIIKINDKIYISEFDEIKRTEFDYYIISIDNLDGEIAIINK